MRHTASLTSGAALSPVAERSEVLESALDNSPSVSGRQQGQAEGRMADASSGNNAAAPPDLFTGMSGFRRTRSNLRTGAAMTTAAVGSLSRVASSNSSAAGQLMHQTSRGMQQARVGQQAGSGQLISGGQCDALT